MSISGRCCTVPCPVSEAAAGPEVIYLEQDIADKIYRQTRQVLVASLPNFSYTATQRWIDLEYSCANPSRALPTEHFRLFM